MSIPKNHHYVSQCHLREFFNESRGEIYIYDKKLDNFYSKSTTKTLFSEDFLNSKVVNGKKDHALLESELKILIEDKFGSHLNSIKEFIISQQNGQDAYTALNFMALMALIGEYRNPEYKSAIDTSLKNLMNDVYGHVKEQGAVISHEDFFDTNSTKYQNRAGYIDIAFKLFDRIKPLDFSIYCISSNDHFLLPDTSAFHVRTRGDVGEIVQLGIPVTDKIFVLATSRKVNPNPSQIVIFEEDYSEEVLDINTDLANFAYKGVACYDKESLKDTIQRIKSRKRK